MPVNIMIGLLALLVALVLYTYGTVGAFRRKTLTRTHVIVLFVGFVFDVVATLMMAIQIGGLDLRPGTPLLHTVLALVAMVGMLLAAVLGAWGFAKSDDGLRLSVSRLILVPWLIWVGVFVWGMIDRGAARISS